MNYIKLIKLFFMMSFLILETTSCQQQQISKAPDTTNIISHKNINSEEFEEEITIQTSIVNDNGETVLTRFNVPDGFLRVTTNEKSFEYYLQNLPLKPIDSKVKYYDGRIKENFNIYESVIDLDIGNKNLQQCADAIMRLRGEYLYQNKAYDKIHFNLTNGFNVQYSKWIEGYRVNVDGNTTTWVKKNNSSNTYEDFRQYMDFVFMYAGTLSLSQELNSVQLNEMNIGDVLIQGGSPGHAVIIIDMAINESTNQKLYMIAQSYMPAQDIQILVNPSDEEISPWYALDDRNKIKTPQWTFGTSDLKDLINKIKQ